MISFVSGISALFVNVGASETIGRIRLGRAIRSWCLFLCYSGNKAYCRLQMCYSSSTSSKMFCVEKISVIRADESQCIANLPSAHRNADGCRICLFSSLTTSHRSIEWGADVWAKGLCCDPAKVTSVVITITHYHNKELLKGKKEGSTVMGVIKRNP